MARTYKRDSRGRFASGGGGGSRSGGAKLPARPTRKVGSKPPKRQGLITQRASAKASRRKLAAMDPADNSYTGALKRRGQKAAATRTANRLAAAKESGRVRLSSRAGVIKPPKRGGPARLKPAGWMQSSEARTDRVAVRGKTRVTVRPAIKTGTIKPKQTISDKQFWRMAQKAQVPTRQENWGGRDRKQGKRVGNMVIGSMSAAPRGVKSYPDYRRAKGMTRRVWNEARLMSDEGKRATIGALQARWRPSRALRLGYQV